MLLRHQKLEELIMVLARMKNILAVVPPRDYMIKPALDLDTRFSWHKSSRAGIMIQWPKNRNIARLTPFFKLILQFAALEQGRN